MLYGFAPGEWEMLYPGTDAPDTSKNMYCYKADLSERALCYLQEKKEKWRPSIHMPREAARLFLRAKDVRVERLQDITEADVAREGIKAEFDGKTFKSDGFMFASLWDSLNAKRGYGWDTDPWIWVYEFERCEKPESEDT